MTREEFLAIYPQFSILPGVVLTGAIAGANARFADFGSDAEEARRLCAAHKLTMYAMSYPQEGTPASVAKLAEAGRTQKQEIASKKAGEVSVSYASTSSAASGTYTGLNDLKETLFGVQLLSLLKLYGFSRYIP